VQGVGDDCYEQSGTVLGQVGGCACREDRATHALTPTTQPSAKDAIAAAIAGEKDQDDGGDGAAPEPKPLGKGHADAQPPADWEPGTDA
jgi:hypothetical protein